MKKILTLILMLLSSFTLGVNATNFVSNGNFEASSATTSSYWAATGSNHTYAIETTSPIAGNYSAKATIGTAVASASSQGLYTYVTLPKAAAYTITFTVKSSVDFTVSGSMGVQGALVQSYGGFTWLGNSTLNSLTANTPKTITFDVTTTTTNTGLCKLAVYYGGLATGATILIDNVTVTDKSGTSLTNTNLCNGDFETLSGSGIYNPSNYTYNGLTTGTPNKAQSELYYGWSLVKLTASTAAMTAAIDNTIPLSGANSMKITSTGTASVTTTDLQFDWVFGGIKDANYTVSFKAKTDAAGGYNLRVALQSWGGNYYINEQTCALTTANQTFTLTSTATFAYSDGRNILKFLLGTLPIGVSVWLDDIVIAVKQTPTITWTQSELSLKTTDMPYVSLTAATSNMSSVTTPASSAITYSSDNTNAVTVNGTSLTIVGAGTAIITASQAADASGFYSAATPVSKSITINQNGYRGALISNGTFELSADASSNVSWWQKTGTVANFTYAIDNTSQISGSNCAKLTVATIGSSTQCALFQYVTLPKPSTYTVTFKAKASTACSIQAALVQSYQPFGWIIGGNTSFNVTTSTQTFSYDITTTSATGLCKFAFYFGNILADIYLDDITIVEKTPLTNANMCNGDFETIMNNAIYSPTNYTYNGLTSGTPSATENNLYFGWSLLKLTASTAAMTATTETDVDKISGNQSIKLTSTGTATVTSTDLQLAYVFAGVKDKQYSVYFKAKASATVTMGVMLQAWSYSANPTITYLPEQTINLTTSVQTFGFTTTNPFLQPDGRNVLQFLLGKLPNGVSVWIDDVVVQPVQSAVTTPALTWSQSLTGLSVGNNPVSLTASSDYTPASSPVASAISYGSSNAAVITVSGSILTIVGAGTSNITAYQAADATGNYSAATAIVLSVTIAKATPTITVTPIGTYTYNGLPQGPNAVTKGGSTGTVTYSYLGVNGTSYSANATQPTDAGNYTVTASVASDANYNAASSSATSFIILPASGSPTGNNLNNSGLSDNQLANTNLTISSGEFIINDTKTVRSLTLAPGAKLTHSSGTLTATNGITLESDATGTATLMDNYIEPTLSATVKQYVTAGRNWYLSAPLNNTADYSVLNKGTSVAEYNETTGLWPTVTTGALTRGKGYVQVATASQGTTGTVSFTGTTNSGNVAVALTNTLTGGKGFNLVGNPYPSYLSWSAVAADNAAANMPTGTMWYRTVSYNDKSAWAPNTEYSLNDIVYNGTRFFKVTTAGTSAASGGPTGGLTGIVDGSVVWNYEGSIYIFATISASGVVSPAFVSNLVPPMQAFWVKSTGGTLTFKNAMRSHNTGGANALKAPKNAAIDIKLIRLNVTNGASADETVIYASADASNAFDTYDAPKYFNVSGSNQPEIYTQVGTEKLVINAVRELNMGVEIPLGFATEKINDFGISASEIKNFDSDLQIVLKDWLQKTEFDLTNGATYEFSSNIVNSINRFSLIFRTPGNTTEIENAGKGIVQVFVNATNQISIIAPEKSNYKIYNAVGQVIERGILNTKYETLNTKYCSGVYFVELFVNRQRETQKVIIH